MRAPGHYVAWGLRIQSEIDVSPLCRRRPGREPDVTIRVGSASSVASAGPGLPWTSAPGSFRLEVDGVARYLVREGREITVEPAGGDETAVITFLLGPVMAACLQQRGVVALHASAVETERGAVLFTGASGSGKSALAAALVQRGCGLLADDVSGLVLGAGGRPEVLPAFPAVQLWADAVEALGWRERTRGRVRDGIEKYRTPVESYRAAPVAVHAVIALHQPRRHGFELEAVPPARALESLLGSTYGPTLAHPRDVRAGFFRALAALAKRAPFAHVRTTERPSRIGALAAWIERRLDAGPLPEAADGRGARRPARAAPMPAPARGSRGGSVVWLASYPKSGNTWLRALLTNYLSEDDAPASINALVGGWRASLRDEFHRYAGLPSSDLSPEEILRLRPLFHERLAADLPRPTFIKVHEACLRTAAGPLFPRAATAGVVYVIRNPCDVAVSFAHHQQWSIDRTVEEMGRPGATLMASGRTIHRSLPQPLRTWSRHVTSWLESGLSLHVARYEDMLADPAAAFGAILRFAGLDPDPVRLAGAIGNARFDRLRAEEEREGFQGGSLAAPSFFRSGTAGGWRAALTRAQVRALVDAHGPVMARFGYLREAEAFLRDAGESSASGSSATDVAEARPEPAP